MGLVVRINLTSVYLCAVAARSSMARTARGVIINLSSGGAAKAHRGNAPYDAAKGGIEALTRALALDLGPYGVRCAPGRPGLDRHQAARHLDEERAERGRTSRSARSARRRTSAGPVAFLASDDARYMTGSRRRRRRRCSPSSARHPGRHLRARPLSARRPRARAVLTMAALGLPRKAILAATGNGALAALGRRYGMRLGASRFVAGETLGDCVGVLRELHARGLAGYAVLLGESVTARAAVHAAVRAYEPVAARLGAERIGATMSIKLTHVGLLIDEELAFRSAREVIGAAAAHGVFVRLDMEESAHVDATLRTYRRLRAEGLDEQRHHPAGVPVPVAGRPAGRCSRSA